MELTGKSGLKDQIFGIIRYRRGDTRCRLRMLPPPSVWVRSHIYLNLLSTAGSWLRFMRRRYLRAKLSKLKRFYLKQNLITGFLRSFAGAEKTGPNFLSH